ncbi:MAG TPA: proteasome ATPase, partial [Pengzhenrongella sp.]
MTESSGYSQSRDLERQLAARDAKIARLSETLIAAREQIVDLKSQLDDLAKPPGTYAIFLAARPDGTVDIMSAGRKMHVGASPALDLTHLRPGQEVMLNEALTVVEVGGYEPVGELVTVKE